MRKGVSRSYQVLRDKGHPEERSKTSRYVSRKKKKFETKRAPREDDERYL